MTTQIHISFLAREVGLSEHYVRKLANDGVIRSTRDHRNWRVFDVSAIAVLKARSNKIRAKRRAAMNKQPKA